MLLCFRSHWPSCLSRLNILSFILLVSYRLSSLSLFYESLHVPLPVLPTCSMSLPCLLSFLHVWPVCLLCLSWLLVLFSVLSVIFLPVLSDCYVYLSFLSVCPVCLYFSCVLSASLVCLFCLPILSLVLSYLLFIRNAYLSIYRCVRLSAWLLKRRGQCMASGYLSIKKGGAGGGVSLCFVLSSRPPTFPGWSTFRNPRNQLWAFRPLLF